MKKVISVLAITIFTLGFAQEAPKKACCSGKDKKECKMGDKKDNKACTMKDHKDCKGTCDMKKEEKKKAA
ncbi:MULTISPECIES: hypothetical protein [Chryseobacterium]|uniref:Uncharacterized protein n=1 Tax=Chryseobacterium salivictor TaxID=2547600 RepID=A0A4P6ZHW6_9FLAO|nr:MULTISPECIES: hypothetical protein [Chryseobacterium]MDQ0475831.1 hypothetical protein [Chryseobacterium sp. MDT2-18]QBO59259.1 hypothetical protein NBC122_02455 [Chryseobacterium salivictor]